MIPFRGGVHVAFRVADQDRLYRVQHSRDGDNIASGERVYEGFSAVTALSQFSAGAYAEASLVGDPWDCLRCAGVATLGCASGAAKGIPGCVKGAAVSLGQSLLEHGACARCATPSPGGSLSPRSSYGRGVELDRASMGRSNPAPARSGNQGSGVSRSSGGKSGSSGNSGGSRGGSSGASGPSGSGGGTRR